MTYSATLSQLWAQHSKEKPKDAPTVISTFAGCGGSSLGFSMAGFKELLAVEWEKNAAQTFKLNFPHVPLYFGDIAQLSVSECLQRANLQPGELDVFDGSPPCQGFSTAGKRKLEDNRNQLFKEYVRLLNGLRPKTFVMENVSGMVKGAHKLIFVEILKELKATGYLVSAKLLDASYFQVPQRRQRMIFIGVREDINIQPTHPLGQSKIVTVLDAIGDLEQSQADRKIPEWRQKAWHLIPEGCPSSKLIQQAYKLTKGSTGGAISTCRLGRNKPSYTITKMEHGHTGLLHYSQPRALTMKELARLGSFPDEYQFIDRKSAVERIGNSVPPLLMKAVAEHIKNNILKKANSSQL